MNHFSFSRILWFGIFVTLVASFCGCGSDTPSTPELDASTASENNNSQGNAAQWDNADTDSSKWIAIGEMPTMMAIDEKCCENTGHADECWERDALNDNVAGHIFCNSDADCATGFECNTDVDLSGYEAISADFAGLCECNNHMDCRGAGGDGGACFDSPESNNATGLCGPSLCNGYYICSCWGGCDWWDGNDPVNRPSDDAATVNLYCCENKDYANYSAAERTVLVSFGAIGCSAEANIECTEDADCDDGNPCSVNTCNATGQCVETRAPDSTECAVDGDLTDCMGPDICISGVCTADVNPLAIGTFCGAGADADTDDCVVGFTCDASADCVETYETAGADCTIDENTYAPNCWDGFCGAVDNTDWYPTFDTDSPDGLCNIVQKDAPDNDSCASGGATVGDMGSFTNSEVGALPTVTGSTICANDTSSSASMNCITDGGLPFGNGANDLVYSFGYTSTDATQQQLYGFVVTVEADFQAVLYTETDTCSDGSVNGHPCQWQPELDDGGSPVPWEFSANNQGRDWNGNDQRCATTSTSEYQWCRRGPSWEYPEDPTNCKFELDGSYACERTGANVAQTFIYPISDEAGTNHRVYIHLDGATTGDAGNFSVTVERLLWQNGQCERVNDGPRVYDITDVSSDRVYRGNLVNVANSSHSSTDETCGGYDCSATWSGRTTAHASGTANAYWPNAAFFKIQPTEETVYCIQTDHTGVTGGIDPILEVLELGYTSLDNTKNLCQGDTAAIVGAYPEEGANGIDFVAQPGKVYLVKISEKGPNFSVCTSDCNYRMLVSEGYCGATCTPTVYQPEDMVYAGGYVEEDVPGWAMTEPGTYSVDHTFTTETSIAVRAKGSNHGYDWPIMYVDVGAERPLDLAVTSRDYTTYTGMINPGAGTQTISVENTYDLFTAGYGDVDLWLDYITVGCDSGDTVVIEEDDGFCSLDGTIDSNHAGYTGDGFSNGFNTLGAGIEWSIEVSTPTSVTLTWNFANGSATDRPGMLQVNGVDVEPVSLPVTGGWNVWAGAQTSVVLYPGTNTIRLEATTGDGLANINSLTAVGTEISVGDCTVEIDTEVILPPCEEITISALDRDTDDTDPPPMMNATSGSGGYYDDHFTFIIEGIMAEDFDFVANSSLTVSVHGEDYYDRWPNMIVRVDGLEVMNEFVTTTERTDYTFEFYPEMGTHEVSIEYTNDEVDVTQRWLHDKNLAIYEVTLGCEGDESDLPLGEDTDTSDNCIPPGAAGAVVEDEVNYTGYNMGYVFVPYDPTYHLSAWGFDEAATEWVYINNVRIYDGDYLAPGDMPPACMGGWYVYININSYLSHVEIKP